MTTKNVYQVTSFQTIVTNDIFCGDNSKLKHTILKAICCWYLMSFGRYNSIHVILSLWQFLPRCWSIYIRSESKLKEEKEFPIKNIIEEFSFNFHLGKIDKDHLTKLQEATWKIHYYKIVALILWRWFSFFICLEMENFLHLISSNFRSIFRTTFVSSH